MINNRNFTDKEIETILKNMVVLVDTREKANSHILEWLDYKNRCEYEKIALSNGDYSCKLKAITELGIPNDLYFHRDLFYRFNSIVYPTTDAQVPQNTKNTETKG